MGFSLFNDNKDNDNEDNDDEDKDNKDNDDEDKDNEDNDDEDKDNDMPCLRSLSPMSTRLSRVHLADLSRTLGLVLFGFTPICSQSSLVVRFNY